MDFLDDYQPNVTAYLSPELRQQLLDMGQAEQIELPVGTYVRQVYNRDRMHAGELLPELLFPDDEDLANRLAGNDAGRTL